MISSFLKNILDIFIHSMKHIKFNYKILKSMIFEKYF
ncbi:hypothetical protein HDEF_1636 [Candidatus Hamiltonella defensa 5AT (Acyrthosiphon pisum)]|uniref:Uncharacterized protein n=1 Tax=Hamiltonella defensa subsp. Acyrthosiphon pisum (strain 5AT) TaxID=572265 RepID=C4K6Q4_HAMD5|nr:hypothetical protein HDEF_1636 [Candidatus Hamiltonella defensa 5AT (Acyrthosiphon pisum)]